MCVCVCVCVCVCGVYVCVCMCVCVCVCVYVCVLQHLSSCFDVLKSMGWYQMSKVLLWDCGGWGGGGRIWVYVSLSRLLPLLCYLYTCRLYAIIDLVILCSCLRKVCLLVVISQDASVEQ